MVHLAHAGRLALTQLQHDEQLEQTQPLQKLQATLQSCAVLGAEGQVHLQNECQKTPEDGPQGLLDLSGTLLRRDSVQHLLCTSRPRVSSLICKFEVTAIKAANSQSPAMIACRAMQSMSCKAFMQVYAQPG